MTAALSPSAPPILHEYYGILGAGLGAYDDGTPLRPLLSEHLDFTGPLAGRRPDSTEGFLRGVAGFIGAVRSIEILQDVHDERGSAVLYLAELPGGQMTFAEFFEFEEGRISTLRVHYAGQEYLDNGGR